MKKIGILLLVIMIMTFLAACGGSDSNGFNPSRTINVITREDGSGTRGAFTEIVGILEEDANGNEVDRTYIEAIVQNSTDAVMTTVAGDEYSIGYMSLGSLNENIKAVSIEGVEPTGENVQNGSYKISRPFNVAYKGDLKPVAQDFLNFILSKEGQEIVVEEGYVQAISDPQAYDASNSQEGNIVVAGSTSVTPVMEKLAEAYMEIHSGVSIEIQSTGSSAGIQTAMEGTADLGMASRELKESELAELTVQVIAVDGIVVIVNKENPVNDLTLEEVKGIFVGDITEWESVID
ncbi:MAG: solute-binding protein [Tissierellia bacterium]|nr:solute-binding protein [Tissierellia bacterium]